MRLLSALNYEEIEEYIKYLNGIETINIVKSKKTLLDAVSSYSYDLVLLSRSISGSEKMEELIETLTSGEFERYRVIFVYGEYDDFCDNFVRFLISHGVYDFYVGAEITSRDIERLIFRPVGKETAFSYFKSRFDNEQYFYCKERGQKQRRSFFNTALLKTKRNIRIPFEKSIISIISNQATGKSHTAWNLGCCFSKRGYATSLFNIDRGYSANLFFNINEIYYDMLDFILQNNKYRDILDHCWRIKNLSIITGKLGDEKELCSDDFLKLLYSIRTKSDITIIDTRTGISDLTRLSMKSSIYDLLVFDCDIMHFHMNMKMLDEMKDEFVPEKTIAVINNTNVKSSGHKFIYNELINTGIPFKDIAFISNCGMLSSEVMHTGLSPYQVAGEENIGFVSDIDNLLDKLSNRPGKNGIVDYLNRR